MSKQIKTSSQEKIHQPMRASAKGKPQPKRGNWLARTVREDAPAVIPPGLPALIDPTGAINRTRYVPVSFVAKDWNVTPRRIRSLLVAKRLEGHREVNGYWVVSYPYHYIMGTRGPLLKRQRKPKRGRPPLKIVGIEQGTIQKITLQEPRKS